MADIGERYKNHEPGQSWMNTIACNLSRGRWGRFFAKKLLPVNRGISEKREPTKKAGTGSAVPAGRTIAT
jgi:hypothetical protein